MFNLVFGDDLFPDWGLLLSLVLGFPPKVMPAPVLPDKGLIYPELASELLLAF